MFELHPQLAKDCYFVCDLSLSSILLMNDSQFPWLIQVPRVDNIKEIIQLDDIQQQQLWKESLFIQRTLQSLYQPDKLNIAALGNMVPQLHVHHIARYTTDLAWPGPVWGKVDAKAYSEHERIRTLDLLGQKFSELTK